MKCIYSLKRYVKGNCDPKDTVIETSEVDETANQKKRKVELNYNSMYRMTLSKNIGDAILRCDEPKYLRPVPWKDPICDTRKKLTDSGNRQSHRVANVDCTFGGRCSVIAPLESNRMTLGVFTVHTG